MSLHPVVTADPSGLAAPTNAGEVAAAFLLGYQGSTRDAYGRDLRDFAAWLEGYRVDPLAVSRAHVDAYARQLEQAGRSRATVARRLACLSGFYKYAASEGLIDRSPLEHVRRPRTDDDSPRSGISMAQLQAMFDVAAPPRDRALLTLLALNGLRVSEALGADIGHLGWEGGFHTLTVTRKGGKRVRLALAPVTYKAIKRVVRDRPKTKPIFTTRNGGRLDRHAALRVVQRIAREAGIDAPVSPHTLRHTFATLALDEGLPLRDLQDALGHADPRTTRRYDSHKNSLERNPTHWLARLFQREG